MRMNRPSVSQNINAASKVSLLERHRNQQVWPGARADGDIHFLPGNEILALREHMGNFQVSYIGFKGNDKRLDRGSVFPASTFRDQRHDQGFTQSFAILKKGNHDLARARFGDLLRPEKNRFGISFPARFQPKSDRRLATGAPMACPEDLGSNLVARFRPGNRCLLTPRQGNQKHDQRK